MGELFNREWILKRRPVGEVADEDLLLTRTAVPRAGEGEVVIRTQWLSLDPSNRIWMSDAPSYMPPVPLDAPMRGMVMGEVVESRSRAFAVGDAVMGMGSWSEYCRIDAGDLQACPTMEGVAVEDVFGMLMLVGPTAYFGVTEIGQPRPGETFVVSGAAGATGSLAGQIAKAMGCRVVGIAGGRDKCAALVAEFGFDNAVDYRAPDFAAQLAAACPDGVDIYFDNVGGEILEAVLARMNHYGRVVFSGAIASYNADGLAPGPKNYNLILLRRLKVQGFIVFDYAARFSEAYRALAALRRANQLRWQLHSVAGLENAVQAMRLLTRGGNNGKLMVKVRA